MLTVPVLSGDNNNNITDNNNSNNNNNWDEKTRVLDPPQYDNSTCDKPRSLFPPPLQLSEPPSSSLCSPGSLCRHSYYDCCAKVAASKLLEHWLDAPDPPDLPPEPSFPEEPSEGA